MVGQLNYFITVLFFIVVTCLGGIIGVAGFFRLWEVGAYGMYPFLLLRSKTSDLMYSSVVQSFH